MQNGAPEVVKNARRAGEWGKGRSDFITERPPEHEWQCVREAAFRPDHRSRHATGGPMWGFSPGRPRRLAGGTMHIAAAASNIFPHSSEQGRSASRANTRVPALRVKTRLLRTGSLARWSERQRYAAPRLVSVQALERLPGSPGAMTYAPHHNRIVKKINSTQRAT